MPLQDLLLGFAQLAVAVALVYFTFQLVVHTKGLRDGTDKLAEVTVRVAALEEGRDRREALRKREARLRKTLALATEFVKLETEKAWASNFERNVLGAPEPKDFRELMGLVDRKVDHIPDFLVRAVESFIDAVERQKLEMIDPAMDYRGAIRNLRSTVKEAMPKWRAEHDQILRDLAAQEG